MTGYEKIVKGATKIKAAAPKTKYLDPLVRSTSEKTAFREVMMSLDKRLGDSAWTVVYKSLIVIHTMIKEGENNVVLKYLGQRPDFLEIPQMRKMNDTNSLVPYARYLTVRGKEFNNVKVDYVRDYQVAELNRNNSRLKALTVEKGLLREVESVLKQIKVLVSTRFTESNITNDITLTSFRLSVNDLLILFNVLNVGVINILEHFFEMSRYDAERALEIYREYCLLTGRVVEYLKIAKHMEYATKLHIPTLKHAPISLVKHLEEYLQNGGPEGDKGGASKASSDANKIDLSKQKQQHQQALVAQPQLLTNQMTSNPFFQQAQQQAMVQPLQQLQPQTTNNPFFQQQVIPIQIPPQQQQQLANLQSYSTGQFSSAQPGGLTPVYTGAGFGGYTPQPQPSAYGQQQPTPQSSTNSGNPQPLKSSQTGNNPFALSYVTPSSNQLGAIQEQPTNNPFSLQNSQTSQTTNPQKLLQQQTNPFALTASQEQQQQQRLKPQPTMGGYETLQTTPVFPSTIQEQRTDGLVQGAMTGLQNSVLQQQYTQGLQQQQAQVQQFTNNPYQQQQQQFASQTNGYHIQQPQTTNPYVSNNNNNGNFGFYDGPSLI